MTTDAKDARTIIEKWRAELPHLVQPEAWMQPIIELLDAYDAMTAERNGLAFAQQHLTRERDEARRDRDRYKEVYESGSEAFIALREAFDIPIDAEVVSTLIQLLAERDDALQLAKADAQNARQYATQVLDAFLAQEKA